MTRPIALVGLRGAGKSSVGAALARHLSRPFVDTDDVLAARAGVAGAGELLASLGEAEFREREARVLAETLVRVDRPVVAPGGGAVERRDARALLAALAEVVWLRAPPAVLAARVEADATARPSLVPGAGVEEELAELLRRRAALYGEVARRSLDADAAPAEELAARLAAVLDGTGSNRP